MKKVFKNGLVYTGKRFVKTDFAVENGRFIKVSDGCEEVDLNDFIVIPGLCDMHTHGGYGVCFDEIKEEDFEKINQYYVSKGATSVLATTSTIDERKLKKQLTILAKLCEDYPVFKGIHMEGPFLSLEYKGGMMKEYLQTPSVEKFKEYQRCAKGYIKLITISPEIDGAVEFIKKVSETGVVVSLGHSGATYEQTNLALANGARSFTHTFNAMKPITHKTEGSILINALESDAYIEIIADGKHVNKDLFKLLLKCKGKNKIIGISDSLKEAGLPDGDYIKEDGRILRKNGMDLIYMDSNTRAGSSIGIFECLFNFSEFTNLDIEECLPVYSKNVADLLNLNSGVIKEGKDADFIIVKDNKIAKVFSKGECVFDGVWSGVKNKK